MAAFSLIAFDHRTHFSYARSNTEAFNWLPFSNVKLVDAFPLIILTPKAQITTAADNIHKYFFHCCSEKIRLVCFK